MKVTSNKKTDTNTIELEIEVSAEELNKAVEIVYQREGKNISVPGFRKGKAPRKVIEKMYGEGMFLEDAVNDLYPKIYSDAVTEIEIEPVAPAEIEIMNVDKDGFSFKAIVTVKPEVQVKDYKGLAADNIIRVASDEEVNKEIDQMLERGSRLVEVEDRPAMLEDTATIDFEGFVDGTAFDGGTAKDHQIVLGSNSFIDTFEDQIVGKNIGEEFDVNVTFPKEYHVDELADQPALFKVKLHSLKKKELPELDDEFAKDVSEFDTLDELKTDIKKNLQESKDSMSKDETENQLVDMVIAKLEGEIPQVMYDARIDEMVQEFEHRLSHQGMNLELYLQYTGMDMESFRKTFREQAERQTKIRLALEKIAEIENLEVTEEDYTEEYQRLAEMYSMEAESLKEMIPKNHVELDIKSNKAVDLIRDNAKITEKTEEEAEKEAKKLEKAKEKEEKAKEKEAKDEAKAKEEESEKKDESEEK